jgi:hypothetical protein
MVLTLNINSTESKISNTFLNFPPKIRVLTQALNDQDLKLVKQLSTEYLNDGLRKLFPLSIKL